MDSGLGAWFAGGRIADIVLLVTAMEAAALIGWRHRIGLSPYMVVGTLLPGIFLLLALRLALTGMGWPLIAMSLLMGGVTHAWDITARIRAAKHQKALSQRPGLSQLASPSAVLHGGGPG